jgi:hypothetical protein
MVVEIHTNFSAWSWLLDLSSGESSIVSESFISTWQWRTSMKTRHLVRWLHYKYLQRESREVSQFPSFVRSNFSHDSSINSVPSSSIIFRRHQAAPAGIVKDPPWSKVAREPGPMGRSKTARWAAEISLRPTFFRSPCEIFGKTWLIWIIFDRYGLDIDRYW